MKRTIETIRDPHSNQERFKVHVWRPEAPAWRVVFVHGIVSHAGWYGSSCKELAARGVEVHFLDRRGSGLSDSPRGDIDRWQTWLTDVEGYLESLPDDLPKLLGGISWGGKLAAAIAGRKPNLVSKLALICPGIYARQFPSPATYAGLGLLSKIGLAGLRVPVPLRDASLFTAVPEYQTFIDQDERTLRRITIRFALADRELTQMARLSAADITTPTWMVLAGNDRIVDNEATRRFFDKIGTDRKRLTVYEQAAHTFEFEPDPRPYFADLIDWATSRGE